MAREINTYNGVTVYRSESGRHIVHFFDFMRPEEKTADFGGVVETYEAMRIRAKKAGFAKYTATEFGGGFITDNDFVEGAENARAVLESRKIDLL